MDDVDGKDDDASVHITLNPMQARAWGKYLQTIVGQMPVREIGADHHFFGNLTVTFDKPEDEGSNIAALPLLIHAA